MEKERKAYEEAKNEAGEAASDVYNRTKEAAGTVADKAKDIASATKEKADQAVSSTGSGIASVGGKMRRGGPQEGMLGKANEAVAGTIERTGRYLEEEGLSGMADDVTEVIRRHPVPAVLVSLGIGFMLACMTTSSRR
jgi:hypothetical protein